MDDIYSIRRKNLARVLQEHAEGNQSQLARSIGKEPNLVNRYLKNKNIGDDIARSVERKYRLESGWMDNAHNGNGPKGEVGIHGFQVTPEGAHLGEEWDKIQGDAYKKIAREFIEGMVAAQKRDERAPKRPQASKGKGKAREERPRPE
jgi:hypothetical protein